jgi:hypothetical protein
MPSWSTDGTRRQDFPFQPQLQRHFMAYPKNRAMARSMALIT